jgi:hypothetical protein
MTRTRHLSGHYDDWRFNYVQIFARASVERESRSCPTKNRVANLAPLRFRRYFTDDNSGFVAGRIRKRNVKVAVCFHFHSDNAASQSEPFVFDSGAL